MLELDGQSLTVEAVSQVAWGEKVSLHPSVYPKIQRAREIIEATLASGKTVYGVNTGFGYLKNTPIPPEDIRTLQRHLILSHACGVGEPFSETVVRAMLLLRANTLIQGHSGVRLEVVQQLLTFLNQAIHPVVPARGSVGASGDLAPLSHLVLALIGEGEVIYQQQRRPSRDVLAELKISPLVLEAKEGLALINGTQPMSALACMVTRGLGELLDIADFAAAMTIQASLGSRKAFRAELHQLRPHPGQITSAANLWYWMQDSELVDSHADCDEVQDAYSFRCSPQVHGASREAERHIREVLEREINSVTDNPLILPETEEVLSCGHFHGQPIALIMDHAAIAISELGNISERRTERLLNPQLNRGLPPFLTKQGGLNSGLMITQYTAAALVSENKVLAHPASVDSIPTSGNQEDHVSMGTIAANKALKILENTRYVLAIELIAAAQALDFRAPLKASAAVEAIHNYLRQYVPFLKEDRYLAPELEKIKALIFEGQLHHQIQHYRGIN